MDFDLLALIPLFFAITIISFMVLGLYLVVIIFRLQDDWVEEEKPPRDD